MISTTPPPGFEWCPLILWKAFRLGKGYRQLSPEYIQYVINSAHRETLSRMLVDDRIQPVLTSLLKAKLMDCLECEDAIKEILHAAATPSEWFIGSVDWNEAEEVMKDVVKHSRTLRDDLQKLIHKPWGLQAKADKETNFSQTGRMLDTRKLVKTLDSVLEELIRECELPSPDRGDIVPKKIQTKDEDQMVSVRTTQRMVSKRALAIIKARLLKREIKKRYVKPHHQVIADLVTLSEELSDPMTADDVRKA